MFLPRGFLVYPPSIIHRFEKVCEFAEEGINMNQAGSIF